MGDSKLYDRGVQLPALILVDFLKPYVRIHMSKPLFLGVYRHSMIAIMTRGNKEYAMYLRVS